MNILPLTVFYLRQVRSSVMLFAGKIETFVSQGVCSKHLNLCRKQYKARFFVIGKTMSRLTLLFGIAIQLLAANGIPAHAADLETALKHIPESVNSLAIVKVQKLVNSPRGNTEGWAKKHQTQFMSGAIHIPPTVDFLVRAFEFYPEDTRATKSFGIAAWQTPVLMSRLAEHEKVHVETIVGHTAIHTDRNSYFAELSPGLVGGVSPDYRQVLARWLRQIDRGTTTALSPYLTEVATQAGDAQIVLALDFQDLIDAKSWRERIKSSSAVADKPNVVTTLTHLTDGLRGVSLKVFVTDKTTAVVSLDFNTVVSQTTKPFLKPLLIDLMGEAGAALDDLAEGEVDAKDKTATIKFELSDAGLRQLMSVVLMPTPAGAAHETAEGADPAASAAKFAVQATKAYFGAVNQVLDDLEKQAKKGGNYNRSAVWHDNFAKKIDQLSMRGVDPDLLSYGANVSSNLRALAVSLRGVPVQVNQLQGSVKYDVQFQTAGYVNSNNSIWSSVSYQPGYVNVNTNQAEIRAQQNQAIAAGAKQREQIWEIIADNRNTIRIKLVQKYGADFDNAK
jgi:hypothetical protein